MVRQLLIVSLVVGALLAPLEVRAQDASPASEPETGTASEPAAPPDDADESAPAAVDKGTFGIGLCVGEPTGVAAKLYLEDDRAIQGAFGFTFANSGLQVHADYVLHPYILQDKDSFTMPVYVGPGVRFIQYEKGRDGERYIALGARGVGGVLFDFKQIPLDVFAEVALVAEYGFADGEGFGLTLNAGIGARYYF